jgi:hypothetical protein
MGSRMAREPLEPVYTSQPPSSQNRINEVKSWERKADERCSSYEVYICFNIKIS